MEHQISKLGILIYSLPLRIYAKQLIDADRCKPYSFALLKEESPYEF